MLTVGVAVQTAYGLTETYGPISSYIPYPHKESGDGTSVRILYYPCVHSVIHVIVTAPTSQQRVYQVFNTTVEAMTVRDPGTMEEVPPNGSTMGEVSSPKQGNLSASYIMWIVRRS